MTVARPVAPRTSTRAAADALVCGTVRRPINSATIPIGRLTRKIGRHDDPNRFADSSVPPTIWPTAPAAPTVAPKNPIARCRSWPAKLAWIVASTCGNIIAAARPWNTRNTIRAGAFGAKPHATEHTVNAAMPDRNSVRRPNRSPSRPPATSAHA